MNFQKCFQCSKPAMYEVGEQKIPLCLDCQFKAFQMQQAFIENSERELNYLSDMMAHQIGLPNLGPKYPERKVLHFGGITLNNIKVNNSTVGNINTGTIGSLDIAITSIRSSNEAAAEAFTKVSEAVIKCHEMMLESKNEVLEILSLLADEISTPKERQRPTLAKTLLSRASDLIGVAADLSSLWVQWSPVIRSALGV